MGQPGNRTRAAALGPCTSCWCSQQDVPRCADRLLRGGRGFDASCAWRVADACCLAVLRTQGSKPASRLGCSDSSSCRSCLASKATPSRSLSQPSQHSAKTWLQLAQRGAPKAGRCHRVFLGRRLSAAAVIPHCQQLVRGPRQLWPTQLQGPSGRAQLLKVQQQEARAHLLQDKAASRASSVHQQQARLQSRRLSSS